jgi:hypothetical protein
VKSRTQQEFARKWVGVVKIKSGDSRVKFTSLDSKDDKVKLFPNGTDSMTVKLADLPKIGQKLIKPNMEGKQFRIRLDEDGAAVEEVGPVNGMFKCRLVSLGKKQGEDGPPAPYVKTYNQGKPDENSHLEFFAVYEVIDGPFKGLKLPAVYLHYKFEGIPEGEDDEGMTRFDTVDTPNASQLHKLQSWAEVHGDILDEPIEWDTDSIEGVSNDVIDVYNDEVTKNGDKKHQVEFANILPILEERALEADRPVNVVIERGYPKLIQAADEYEEDEEIEEKPAPKKQPRNQPKDIADETEEEFEEKFPPKSKAPATAAKKVKKSKPVDDEEDDL